MLENPVNPILEWSDNFLTYRGLIVCDSCGCAVTGERRKGRYVYYHCTWRHGDCGNKAYVTEQDLTAQFAAALDNIKITEQQAQLLISEIEQGAGQAAALRESKIAFLRQEAKRLSTRIKAAYEDKLDGKLSESEWLEKANEWKGKLHRVEDEAVKLEASTGDSVATLKRVLELVNSLKYQFETIPDNKKGAILKNVCWNLRLRDKTLSFSYTKPFDIFAKKENLKIGVADGTILELKKWLAENPNGVILAA